MDTNTRTAPSCFAKNQPMFTVAATVGLEHVGHTMEEYVQYGRQNLFK